MLEHTLLQLRQLKLLGMADALQLQSEQPGNYDALCFAERVALMADAEHTGRENRKQTRLLKAANLKLAANAQGIDYGHKVRYKKKEAWNKNKLVGQKLALKLQRSLY